MTLLDLVNRSEQAIIDDDDYERCIAYRWARLPLHRGRYGGYVYTWLDGSRRRGQMIYLHQHIAGRAPAGQCIDHINRNVLDNRRSNIRFVTYAGNNMNHGPRRDSTTGVRGVQPFPRNKTNPWVARIRVNGRYINLGYFATVEEATLARQYAELKYYGELCPLPGREFTEWGGMEC